MKCIFYKVSILLEVCFAFIQIELKKSVAKNHSDYLMKMKLMQIYTKKKAQCILKGYSSFLEEKEISLH